MAEPVHKETQGIKSVVYEDMEIVSHAFYVQIIRYDKRTIEYVSIEDWKKRTQHNKKE